MPPIAFSLLLSDGQRKSCPEMKKIFIFISLILLQAIVERLNLKIIAVNQGLGFNQQLVIALHFLGCNFQFLTYKSGLFLRPVSISALRLSR
jgi:hypothetical protein